MAIPKLMRAAIRALSKPDYHIKKIYRIVRHLEKVKGIQLVDPVYKPWNYYFTDGKREVPARIFESEKDRLTPNTLLFFHGGGWITGDIESYQETCIELSRMTGFRVISVDYRLAPEYRFPAGLDDCYLAAKEVFHRASFFHAQQDSIVLMGDSAGGNLAAAVSLKGRDLGEFQFQKQILLYPSLYNDHHPETSPFDSVRENGTGNLLTAKQVNDYLELYKSRDEDLKDPYFAPLLESDFSNQPDTLILSAELDPLRDEGEAYGAELLKAGNRAEVHRIPEGLHGFFSSAGYFQQKKLSYEYINRFLNEGISHEDKTDTMGKIR